MKNSHELDDFDGKFIDGLKFCQKAYKLLEEIRGTKTGISDWRMRRTPVVKKLQEEILPICKYVQDSYRLGQYIEICWKSGNQQYDAKVSAKGFFVDDGQYPKESYIEVVTCMHENDYLEREKIDKVGYSYHCDGLTVETTKTKNKDREINSRPILFGNLEFIDSDAKPILKALNNKINKEYPPNTVLVVQCYLSGIYSRYEWRKLMEHVEGKLKELKPFDFRHLFITDSNHKYIYTMYN